MSNTLAIKHIKIKNFKGIRHLELKPMQINIIVGRNNTGKTSILQAIRLHNIIYAAKAQNSIYIPWGRNARYLINVKSGTNAEININGKTITISTDPAVAIAATQNLIEKIRENAEKILQHTNEKKYQQLKKIVSENVDEYVLDIPNRIKKGVEAGTLVTCSTHNGNLLLLGKIPSGKAFEKREKDNHIVIYASELLDDLLIGNTVITRTASSLIISPDMAKRRAILVLRPTTTEAEQQKHPKHVQELENIIRKYQLIPDFERIVPPHIVKKSGETVPISEFGDGLIQFLGIAHIVSSNRKSVVLLDEPSAFMHPGYTYQLAKYLATAAIRERKQLFIVTHNADLIDGFLQIPLDDMLPESVKSQFVKELQIILLQEGNTDPIMFNYEDAKEAYEKALLDLRGI